MSSNQFRNSHYKDRMIWPKSYLYNRNAYIYIYGKTVFIYKWGPDALTLLKQMLTKVTLLHQWEMINENKENIFHITGPLWRESTLTKGQQWCGKWCYVWCKHFGFESGEPITLFYEFDCLKQLRPGQDSNHFPDNVLKCNFLNENAWIFLWFHWSLFLRIQLTIFQHWLR